MKMKKPDIARPPTKVSPMKTGSRKSTFAPRPRVARLMGLRSDLGRVSCWNRAVMAKARTAATAMAAKIARQPVSAIIPAPASGASMGETEKTSMISPINLVAS